MKLSFQITQTNVSKKLFAGKVQHRLDSVIKNQSSSSLMWADQRRMWKNPTTVLTMFLQERWFWLFLIFVGLFNSQTHTHTNVIERKKRQKKEREACVGDEAILSCSFETSFLYSVFFTFPSLSLFCFVVVREILLSRSVHFKITHPNTLYRFYSVDIETFVFSLHILTFLFPTSPNLFYTPRNIYFF